MNKIGPILLSIAFIVSMFIQFTPSLIENIWVLLLCTGCLMSFKNKPLSNLGIFCFLWFIGLFASLMLVPFQLSWGFFWCLAAMPMVALCVDKENGLALIGDAFLATIIFYACGLIFQVLMDTQYTNVNFEGHGLIFTAWPLVDPNNGACVINCGLIYCFSKMLKQAKWGIPVTILLAGLLATQSKGGMIAAAISCGVLLGHAMEPSIPLVMAFFALMFSPFFSNSLMNSMDARWQIWHPTLPYIFKSPLWGNGIGSYLLIYKNATHGQDGSFAHNDILQFSIELGLPITVIFVSIVINFIKNVTRKTLPVICVFLAIFIQSMVEFQFYVPPISMLAGLALSYGIPFNVKRNCAIKTA